MRHVRCHTDVMELVGTYGVFETSKGHKSPEGAYRIQKLYTKGPDISNTKNKKAHYWTQL